MRMEIYIGGQQAFTDSATTPKITKQVIDIQKPENRKTDRTLTFSMPGTPANDSLFGGMFDVNLTITNTSNTQFNPDFNPNLRASFLLLVDSVIQLSGYCQLTDIKIQRDNTVRYMVVAYGVTSDLFSTIGDSLLTALDFSEYDHQWSKANIENSWDTSIQVNGSPVSFELGTGYVYPMIDYGQITNPNTWKTTNFLPALYYRTILDKIFSAAGFTYDSDFFDSERFKRLVAPFTGVELKVSDTDAANRLIDVERITTDQTLTVCQLSPVTRSYNLATGDDIAFNQENSDPSNQWSTDTYTVVVQGEYIFQGYLDFAFKNNSGGAKTGITGLEAIIGLVKYDGANYTVIGLNRTNTPIDPGASWAAGNTTSSEDVWLSFPAVRLLVGETVFVKPLYVVSNAGTGRAGIIYWAPANIQVVVKIGSYLTTQMGANQIIENDTIPINSTLPVDMKQSDFLVGLIRDFNLYVEPHPTISNRLVIEPRDDYYTTDSEDWTYKLDESQDFTIEPMGLLDAETYLFQYSPDSDYLNKAHQDRYGYTYGRRKIVVNNQFVKSQKVIQPAFAATPLAAPQGYADRIVSQIIFVDQNGQVAQKASKMRMLYYGGLKSCLGWFFVGTSGSTIKTSYPYAGHLDDPKTPTFDLNFGAPAEIYYGAAFASVGQLQYTDNNLYKAYWQKFIEEITNKDSKVVSGFFYLKPSDIATLSFRKRFFVKETYYRLLSVNNYDPISNAPCLCVFLKAKDSPQAAATQVDTSGGTGTVGEDTLPVWDIPRGKNGNEVGNTGNTILLGEDNAAGGNVLQLVNIGDDNLFGGNASTMLNLGGSGNVIAAENVVVINSSDQTVTEDGVTVINNVRQAQRVTVEVSSAEMLAIGTTPIQALPAPGEGRFIEVVGAKARRQNSTVGYSSQVIVVQYETSGVNPAAFATELLTATGDNIYKATIAMDLSENDGIQLTTQSVADPTTGDGDYIFYIDYIIQNI